MMRVCAPSFLVLLLLAACGAGDGDANTDPAVAARAAGTVNGVCPVQGNAVVPGFATELDGQKVGFCCAPCIAKFRADPEKYLAKMRAERAKYGYTGK